MSATDTLISTLETFGLPVFRQGSLAEDAPYPDAFFTFWNTSSEGACYYDDVAHAVTWSFYVYHYTSDIETLESKLSEAAEALRAIGFVISGMGFDVGSDVQTHFGRAVTARYTERKEPNNGKE